MCFMLIIYKFLLIQLVLVRYHDVNNRHNHCINVLNMLGLGLGLTLTLTNFEVFEILKYVDIKLRIHGPVVWQPELPMQTVC